jgi:SAM-dependent methyltransferase
MAMTATIRSYRAAIERLFAQHDRARAAELAVGGNYTQLGDLELSLLRRLGLTKTMAIVDVGAGSGRLAAALMRWEFRGSYLGTDISADLISFAREHSAMHYRFQLVDSFSIPEKDETADFICFFSVFTHLLHEESFVYLRDALRVIKPGGLIVVSYLDFAVPDHWEIFERTVDAITADREAVVFTSQDLWKAYAEKLGLDIVLLQPGGIPFIPIEAPITFSNGVTRVGLSTLGPIGQSVIAFKRRSALPTCAR